MHTRTRLLDRFTTFETLAFYLFCASVPLLFPIFDIWRSLLPFEGLSRTFFPTASFYDALPLAAMFTALTVLFICLLKTTYARISRRMMVSALICYALSYVLANLLGAGLLASEFLGTVCGVLMGYGAAVLTLNWVNNLHLPDFRSAFLVVWIATCVLFVNLLIVNFLDDGIVRLSLTGEALISAAGCLHLFLRRSRITEPSTKMGSNWWDVFGRFDISFVEGTEDFKALSARALFLIVVPAVLLLLFIDGVSLIPESAMGKAAIILGGLIAVAAMGPLLLMKSDQALINFSYRFFIPFLAFFTLVLAVFFGGSLEQEIIRIGAFAFCAVYSLTIAAMLFAMAGRMHSLGLPAASMIILAGCMVCLLSNTNGAFDVLEAYRDRILVVLLAVAVVALTATPSARLWRLVLNGIDEVEIGGLERQEKYIRRCDELAQEYGLTAREAEILQILGRGHTSSFVAKELTVAESTIRSHRKNIYRKLDVSSREDLFNLLDDESRD